MLPKPPHIAPPHIALIGLLLSLSLVWTAGIGGCDDQTLFDLPGPDTSDQPSDGEKIPIGPADQYDETGLYDPYLEDHDVLLVSRPASGGQMLVALRAVCPNDEAGVRYDQTSGLLQCPRCDSAWTTDGLVRDGSIAERSLARLRLILDRGRESKTGSKPTSPRLIVDSSRRYHQREVHMEAGKKVVDQQWSATDSMYMFAQDPRHRALSNRVRTP